MTRIGNLFGPDFTFLGVPKADLDEPVSFADADVVILGAPFDGGTSYRSGARFGPQAIRGTDNNPHDGSRPSLALRTDALRDLNVVDAGDVEIYSGDIERSLGQIREAVATITAAGPIPIVLGGDHSITYSDTSGIADVLGQGRISLIHFDAHADTGDIEFGSLWGHGQPMRRLIESGAVRGDRFLQIGLRGYWPGPETLDWMANEGMRSYEMTEIVHRGLSTCLTEAFAIATDDCDGVFLSVDIDVCDPGHAPGTGTPEPGGLLHGNCSTPSAGSAWNYRSSVWMSSRWRHPTTMPISLRYWLIALCWKRFRQSRGDVTTKQTAPGGIRPSRFSTAGWHRCRRGRCADTSTDPSL